MDQKRTAIIFTANSSQLAQSNLMLDSLQDKNKGNYKGDIWVISSELSDDAKNYLDCRNIKYLINPMTFLFEWKNWMSVTKAQPDYKKFLKTKDSSESLYLSYENYRNKYMNRIIILDWVNKFGNNYDFIALGDSALYFQKDVAELFDQAYKTDKSKIHYSHEEVCVSPNTEVWRKNYNYLRYYNEVYFDFGKYNINTGFILGSPQNMYILFNRVKELYMNLHIGLFTLFNWDTQDIVRLIGTQSPEMFTLLSEGDVVHLCNGGRYYIEERYPGEYYHKETAKKPYILNFAYEQWINYPSISDSFKINHESYFSYETQLKYNKINDFSQYRIFNDVSELYFSEDELNSKINARKKWAQLSGEKKKVVYIGWLRAEKNKKTELLKDYFINDVFDLAALYICVDDEKHEDFINEMVPIIISKYNTLTNQSPLLKMFSTPIKSVPEWIFEDCEKSILEEISCSKRAARAVANLAFLYYNEALEFYRPDLVCVWNTMSPIGKLINKICYWKGISVSSMEYGVLQGTVINDFCGHMGESWVAREYKYFNNLVITDDDIKRAREYLEVADDPELSRKKLIVKEPYDEIDKLQWIRKKKQKILLYMGSCGSHSGNILADSDIAKKHSPFFYNDDDAYEAVLEVCKKIGCHILYKPHPIYFKRGIKPTVDDNYTTVIFSGGLDDALDFADASVTILSQGSYVSLFKKVPAIMLGVNQLNGSGAAYVLDKKENLEELIIQALEKGYTNGQKKRFEEHVARLLKYYVYSFHEKVKGRSSLMLCKDILDIIEGKQADYLNYEREAFVNKQKNKKEIKAVESLKVSVIIPVCNAEKYLSECINSVLNQTLSSFELICIINGSTDSSQYILEYFAAKDHRIKLYYLKERNKSAAYNMGINNAKGEYIYFIESDGFLDREALEELTDLAEEKKSDIVYFFYRNLHLNMEKINSRPEYFSYKRFLPEEQVFSLDKEYYKFFIQYPYPWAKLVKRDIIIKKALFFDEKCVEFGEYPYNINLLFSAGNPYVCNKILYNYRVYKEFDNESQQFNSNIVNAICVMNKMFEKKGKYFEYQKWYVPFKIYLLTKMWNLIPEEHKKEYYESLGELFINGDKVYLNNDDVISYFDTPSISNINLLKSMLSMPYEQFLNENMGPMKPVEENPSSVKARIKRLLSKNPRAYGFIKNIYLRLKSKP